MNTNTINNLQPTTIQQTKWKFYPTILNTIENPMGISDEAIELAKRKPISERLVSCYVRSLVDGADYNGDYLPLGALLNANSPQVEALRNEPSYIKKKQIEDELPIFTPCCVLRYDFGNRAYYPINYTCLLDFDIIQDDNPNIDFAELKPELSALPQMAYCGLATNGLDLYCLVPISTPQRYADHARALIHRFRNSGIIIRIADNITHTRTISSDPEARFNDGAIEFTDTW